MTQKDGKTYAVVLEDVKYVPGLFCNLISITQLLNKNFSLAGTKESLVISKGKKKIAFDHTVRSGKGVIFGIKIGTETPKSSLKADKPARKKTMARKVTKMQAHKMLGHPSDAKTVASAKRLGYELIQKTDFVCEDCVTAKTRQKTVKKITEKVYKRPGDMMYMDISSVQKYSQGGKKFWILWRDAYSRMSFSQFVKNKSDLAAVGVKFLTKIKNNYGVSVKIIRCDNAGENLKLQEKLEELGFGVNFEYTAAGTPQHNGVVERLFATLYGQVRAMLNGADFGTAMRGTMWAECAATATMVENLLVNKETEKSPFEIFSKKRPKYGNNLRTFGEIGVVRNYAKKIKAKLDNRGKVCAMVGYANDHSGDVYRMLDINTKQIKTTRDVIWLNKPYGIWKGKSDSSDSVIVDDDFDEDADDEAADVTEDKGDSPRSDKVNNELRRLNTFYNRTIEDVVEFAMVGGTDNDYVNPISFQDAWWHPDPEERKKWREAIRKEMRDMIRRGVWRKVKRSTVPSERRVIGNRWVFKLKGNGVYRARLVGLGYAQIPGVDHQDNFSPVVVDVTFRVVIVIMLVCWLIAEIVDVETAFLYGELEEEIYMDLPVGFNAVMELEGDDDECVLLDKAIYGLVQAARQFF